ncbi:MAG: hypothetical protein KatS3mg015_2831 [Fimbriimonadales bacterium]|nr:MAG: hypothetical protein KatS3mg015_2831 [Fimbriimonadales bacterium]
MVSEETRRKMSEAQKRAWRRRHAEARGGTQVHVFHGYSARTSDAEDRCLYCDRRYAVMAYTYFGAPVCGYCWDRRWRKTDDGESDPPFSRIRASVSGEWLLG